MGRITGSAHLPEQQDVRAEWRFMENITPRELINQPADMTDDVMDGYLFSPEEVEARRQERQNRAEQLEDEQMDAERQARARQIGDGIYALPSLNKPSSTSLEKGSRLHSSEGFVTRTLDLIGEPGHEVPNRSKSPLSITNVVNVVGKSELQKAEPFFTDPTGTYYHMYEKLLEDLSGNFSQGPLCVEEYLMASEKDWFSRFHNAKMGRASPVGTPRGRSPSPRRGSPSPRGFQTGGRSFWGGTTPAESAIDDRPLDDADLVEADIALVQFALPDDYETPTGIKRVMLVKIGD